MKRLIFLALTGCSAAYTAEAPVQSEDVAVLTKAVGEPAVFLPGLIAEQALDTTRMEGNASYTTEVLEASVLHIQLMSEPQRETLVDAMSLLVSNCPYTRAKVMIFLTLDEGLSAMDPSTLSPAGQVRFAQVLRGVKAEAEFFRATNGDALPMPLSIDYLASSIQVVDGPTFAASDEPVTLSWAAIEQIDDAVAGMPARTQESIQAAWAVLDPHLGDDVVLHFNERFTRDGLRALEKTESADALPEGLTALAAMMDEFLSHGC